jgi:hypothetical protein
MRSRCKTLESHVTKFTYFYLSEANLLQKKTRKSQLKRVCLKKSRLSSKYASSIPESTFASNEANVPEEINF